LKLRERAPHSLCRLRAEDFDGGIRRLLRILAMMKVEAGKDANARLLRSLAWHGLERG
jgi:hypothetical protein